MKMIIWDDEEDPEERPNHRISIILKGVLRGLKKRKWNAVKQSFVDDEEDFEGLQNR